MTLLAALTLRSSIVVLVGLAATLVLGRRSAALRHAVLTAALFAAALTVPLSLVLPSWSVPAFRASAESAPHSATVEVQHRAPARALPAGPIDEHSKLLSQTLVGAWFAGVVFGAVLLIVRLARLRRIARRADRERHSAWDAIVFEIAAAYRLRRPVVICLTQAPDLLATFGLFRPRVLVPAQAREWSDERVRIVLGHELAHIRRHDWLVQISAEVLRIVFWFNPLFRAVCTRLRREGEQACDDTVLRSGVQPRIYAAHLLELARTQRPAGRGWAAAIPMARPSTLERRFAAMLNPALDRTPPSRRALILTAVMIAAVTLPAAAFRARQGPLPLAGSVYDATGAVLPAVALTVEDDRQNKWEAATDASGRFEFPQLEPGHYVLQASLPGFRALRHEFELRSARDWDRAITLQVGDVRESIAVTGQRPSGSPAAPAAQGPQRIRVGGNIRVPRKLVDVRPVYPASMREAGREGVVPIEAIIGTDGAVHSVRVLSANIHPDFAVAAVDAVRQWRFIPTLLNGEPVEVTMTVTVKFTLSE